MQLTNKTIFILSPQPWGVMHLSKHHYAIELAKRSNKVFFISPPNYASKEVTITSIENHPNLKEVIYSPFFNWNIRFHARFIFDWLIRLQIKTIINTIGQKPDVVWCFDPNTYTNLKWFGATLNIYHPVDPITRKDQIIVAKSADVVFSVSTKILSAFNDISTPKFFINHGLANEFVEQAKINLAYPNHYQPNKPLKVGYIGNILRTAIDRTLFLKIIEQNTDIDFHLWGPYEMQQSNIGGVEDKETQVFITKLKSLPNIILEGVKPPSVLCHEIQKIDIFLLTYQFIAVESDRSNSHKILEYLSTGKVTISVNIDTYANTNLLLMSSPTNDDEIITILKQVKLTIHDFNSDDKMGERLIFSINNSMDNQLLEIQKHIDNITLKKQNKLTRVRIGSHDHTKTT